MDLLSVLTPENLAKCRQPIG